VSALSSTSSVSSSGHNGWGGGGGSVVVVVVVGVAIIEGNVPTKLLDVTTKSRKCSSTDSSSGNVPSKLLASGCCVRRVYIPQNASWGKENHLSECLHPVVIGAHAHAHARARPNKPVYVPSKSLVTTKEPSVLLLPASSFSWSQTTMAHSHSSSNLSQPMLLVQLLPRVL
jgi:hypothetical protein